MYRFVKNNAGNFQQKNQLTKKIVMIRTFKL